MGDERVTAEESVPAHQPTSPDPGPAKREGDPLLADEPGSRQGLEPDEGAPAEGALTEGAPDEPEPAEGAPAEAAPDEPEPRVEDGGPDYLALAQRTQADFDNYRKRTARELRAAEARGTSRVVKELLPALDHLHLALENLDGPQAEGVRLVQRELLAALARVGIEPYSPQGEPFDPQVHEAVAQVPQEGVAAGTVFEVMQHGYRHGDAVLRPARVVVVG